MASADYNKAIEYALEQLRLHLAPEYVYHNLWHTEEEVPGAVRRLARLCQVTAEDEQLLLVATAYHDIGFLETYREHELASARIMVQTLPAFGFQTWQIERIMGMIMATRLPQSPRNLAEEILADADLDVLGRGDFFARNEMLRQECAVLGRPYTQQEWLESQLAFLRSHTYFTAAARELRQAGKQKHITTFAAALARLGG